MSARVECLRGRRACTDALQQAVDRIRKPAQLLAVLVIRVRQLRENYDFCYDTADLLLNAVSTHLHELLRDTDIIAQIADADLVVIVPELASTAQAELLANSIIEMFERPIDAGAYKVKLDIGIGIAYCPLHALDPQQLIRCAATAARRACGQAEGYVIYAEEHDRRTGEPYSFQIETALIEAIEQQELTMFLQPKIHLGSERIVGAEALMRWQSSQQGSIPPNVFIPIAERSTAMRHLTLWSINTTLRQCREFFEGVANFSVAVNLSPAVLTDPAIADAIMQATGIWCTSGEQLTLEITESALMQDQGTAIQILDELHDFGIKLSIDDFGTGYSSLAQLSLLRVGELKIDRSFIARVTEIERNAQIVKSIIDLAHNFGMTVVAEGIEDEKTFAYLHSLGCDYGQGYYIGKPMPTHEFSAWLSATRFATHALELPAQAKIN
jgi:diguanylate cyclase (GGDEF)-like protein